MLSQQLLASIACRIQHNVCLASVKTIEVFEEIQDRATPELLLRHPMRKPAYRFAREPIQLEAELVNNRIMLRKTWTDGAWRRSVRIGSRPETESTVPRLALLRCGDDELRRRLGRTFHSVSRALASCPRVAQCLQTEFERHSSFRGITVRRRCWNTYSP